jgi:hypothetical protein
MTEAFIALLAAAIAAVATGLLVLVRRRRGKDCAYPGGRDSRDPRNRPPTPSAAGFPDGSGFRGAWEKEHVRITSILPSEFVWRSYREGSAGKRDYGRARGRGIIFRLEGDPGVRITGVTRGGGIAFDGRSAYGCCDDEGRIYVDVYPDPEGSYGGEGGRLWAIDVGATEGGAGLVTEFGVGDADTTDES